jgi:dihydropteroate synthase
MQSPPLLMGILNITPDSFSDGGAHGDPVAAGFRMLEAGADIIDIGGESTRPGAAPVTPAEEQARILPTVEKLAREGARVSVDTRNAGTMRAALDAGAAIINDVTALAHDPEAAALLARHECGVVLTHMRGTPQTMMQHATYTDLLAELCEELGQAVARAEAAGIARARITLDPGLGFAKAGAQNVAVLRGLPALAALGLPILVGASRKKFIGQYGGENDPARRGPGSIAAALFAVQRGAAILRVHDVAETRQALNVWLALACADG